MGPRERAAAAKLDYDRRCRWTALVMLAARASHSLDQLVWERNNRDANKDASTAAVSLQRKYRNKTMRRQLELLHKSSQCLKKNVAAFAFRWRLRKKVRSGDALREFLTIVSKKSSMAKTIHHFIYCVIKVQRCWKKHAAIISAQLGIFAVQFDLLVKTKKSADLHMNDAERRAWMVKIGDLMLQKAGTQTRAGQRGAARQAAATSDEPAAAEAAGEGAADAPTAAEAESGGGEAEADGDKEKEKAKGGGKGKGGRRGSTKGKGGKGDGTGGLPPGASDRFGVVDLDCKMLVLSRHLRRRKAAYRVLQRQYEIEQERADAMAAQHREMEEARAAFGLAAMPEAGGGVTDLNKQVGSFADMVAATPPPRPKVLLSKEETTALIVEALMLTADKLSGGLIVETNRSSASTSRALA